MIREHVAMEASGAPGGLLPKACKLSGCVPTCHLHSVINSTDLFRH